MFMIGNANSVEKSASSSVNLNIKLHILQIRMKLQWINWKTLNMYMRKIQTL